MLQCIRATRESCGGMKQHRIRGRAEASLEGGRQTKASADKTIKDDVESHMREPRRP